MPISLPTRGIRVRCIFMHQWCMSGAHIEMNAAMNGLSSYSIRLDWDSYIRRMHVPLRVRNVNSISKMRSLSLSLSLSLSVSLSRSCSRNRNFENVRTSRARIPLPRFSIPENHSNVSTIRSSVHSYSVVLSIIFHDQYLVDAPNRRYIRSLIIL